MRLQAWFVNLIQFNLHPQKDFSAQDNASLIVPLIQPCRCPMRSLRAGRVMP